MAEAFFNFYNKNPQYKGISAGTKPAKGIQELSIQVMEEKNISLKQQKPKMLDLNLASSANRIYTMGCIQECPITPPEKTREWNFEDPSGKSVHTFRRVRDEIEKKIIELVADLNRKDVQKDND